MPVGESSKPPTAVRLAVVIGALVLVVNPLLGLAKNVTLESAAYTAVQVALIGLALMWMYRMRRSGVALYLGVSVVIVVIKLLAYLPTHGSTGWRGVLFALLFRLAVAVPSLYYGSKQSV